MIKLFFFPKKKTLENKERVRKKPSLKKKKV